MEHQFHAFKLKWCQHVCTQSTPVPAENTAGSFHVIALNILLRTFHFLLILSSFLPRFASRLSPWSPALPFHLASCSCLIFPTVQCSFVQSASAGLYLPFASRHFCQHNFWKFCRCFHLVTQLIHSPHKVPVSFLSWSHLWAWREKKWLLQGTEVSVFSWSSSTLL